MKTRMLLKMLAMVALLVPATAHAQVDQLFKGRSILIKNPSLGGKKATFKMKGNVVMPAGAGEDPRCPAAGGSGVASLTLTSLDTGETFTIDLGGANCSKWKLNAAGDRLRYGDPSGATCTSVLIRKKSQVKASCKGAQVDYQLGADQVRVSVVVSTGTSPLRYCTAFSKTFGPETCLVKRDGSDGIKFRANGCKFAPASCGGPIIP